MAPYYTRTYTLRGVQVNRKRLARLSRSFSLMWEESKKKEKHRASDTKEGHLLEEKEGLVCALSALIYRGDEKKFTKKKENTHERAGRWTFHNRGFEKSRKISRHKKKKKEKKTEKKKKKKTTPPPERKKNQEGEEGQKKKEKKKTRRKTIKNIKSPWPFFGKISPAARFV